MREEVGSEGSGRLRSPLSGLEWVGLVSGAEDYAEGWLGRGSLSHRAQRSTRVGMGRGPMVRDGGIGSEQSVRQSEFGQDFREEAEV